MQIHVHKTGVKVALTKTELGKLNQAVSILEALAQYAQDSAAEDAREAIMVVTEKYQEPKPLETA